MLQPSRIFAGSPGRQQGTSSPRALSQQELQDAIRNGVVDGISRLGLLEKQNEVIESVRASAAVDLTPISRGLAQLLPLKDSHSEVLEAITNVTVEPPDLSPILQAISSLSSATQGHKEMMEATTNIVVDPPDLSLVQKMMQDTKSEIKEAIDEFRRELQEDLGVLQQEVLRNRQVLLEDFQVVPRELEELRNEIRRLAKKEFDQSEVLSAVRQIKIPEYNSAAIADAVHSRLQSSRLRVDNSDVLQGLQSLEINEAGFANLVVDRIRKLTLSVNTDEVLQAINRLPDAEAVSKCVIDKTKKIFPDRSDFSEISDIVKRIKREPDMTPVLSAIQNLEVDLQPVLDAIGRIKFDNSEVLDTLRKIECPGIDEIGRTVNDRLRKSNMATREDLAEILGFLKKIPDNSEVLDALRSSERGLDSRWVVDSIRGNLPDTMSIASAVADKLKRTNLHMDNSELLSALSSVRLAVSEVGHFDMQALANIEFELRQLREFGLANQRVVQTVVPQAPPVVKQMVKCQSGTMLTMPTTSAMVSPRTQTYLLPKHETTTLTPGVPVGTTQQTVSRIVSPRGYSPMRVSNIETVPAQVFPGSLQKRGSFVSHENKSLIAPLHVSARGFTIESSTAGFRENSGEREASLSRQQSSCATSPTGYGTENGMRQEMEQDEILTSSPADALPSQSALWPSDTLAGRAPVL